jgi:hypothetical protein
MPTLKVSSAEGIIKPGAGYDRGSFVRVHMDGRCSRWPAVLGVEPFDIN